MKSLQESLFDDNVAQEDILLGDVYKLSPVSHYNGVTNNARKVFSIFDEKTLKKEKFRHHVSPTHGFIEYWKEYDSRIDLFVDMILNIPLKAIKDINGNKCLEEYLSKYFSYHGGKAKDMYIDIKKMRDDMIGITIYDNVRLFAPSSIKLTFEKR